MEAEHGPDCTCDDEDCLLRRRVAEKVNGLLESRKARTRVVRAVQVISDTREYPQGADLDDPADEEPEGDGTSEPEVD